MTTEGFFGLGAFCPNQAGILDGAALIRHGHLHHPVPIGNPKCVGAGFAFTLAIRQKTDGTDKWSEPN